MPPALRNFGRRSPPVIWLAACLMGMSGGPVPAAETSPSGSLAATPALPLTRVAAVKTWAELAGRALPVELEGVVTYAAGAGSFFLHDGEMGIHVGQSEGGKRLKPGDRVRVLGVTRRGAFAPSIEPREVAALGRGTWPEPRPATYDEVAGGTLDGDWLEMEGVVREVRIETAGTGSSLTLGTAGRQLRVTVSHPEAIDPETIVDAEVRLRGVASGSFNQQRQLVEPVLRMPGWSFLSVVQPPPTEPFAVPVESLNRLLGYSLEGPSAHRVRIRGVVTSSHSERVVFLREGDRGIKVELANPTGLNPGEEIEVVGFPTMDRGSAVMENAVARVLRLAPVPAPVRIGVAKLLEGSHSADLVTVRMRLVDWVAAGDAVALVLQGEGHFVRATIPRVLGGEGLPENNSIVDATGICVTSEAEAGWREQPRGYALLLSGSEDLVMVEAPNWWTAKRLGWALAVVLGLLVLGLGWVWALRRQVRRSRAIVAAQARHAAVLEERSRIARDLHDTLEQGLTALSLQLKVVEMDHREAPQQVGEGLEAARQMLRRSRALAHDAIRELRVDDVALRPESLVASLQRSVATWAHSGFPGVTLAIEGAERMLPRETERHLAAIATEAITNAVKHGQSTAIAVSLCYLPESLRLQIRDNGRGFDYIGEVPGGAGGIGGFGLMGIRERVAAIGGRLEVQSSSGGGTSVAVEIPCSGATAPRCGPSASVSPEKP